MQPIIHINLTNRKIREMTIPLEWEQEYLGGASLAARLLYDYLTPSLDPLSSEAPLLFLNGPLSGTAGPAVGRFVICARSPATGLWGESNCGGFWGTELRMAGFDGVLVTGAASSPVYIWLSGKADGQKHIELRPADHMWGKNTYETQAAIINEVGLNNVRVATIGKAGETKIPFALILCDHGRVAGRTGMGAVMGSKNLKAIAVKGGGSVPVYHPVQYSVLRSISNRELRNNSFSQVMRELGSAGGAEYFDYLRELPKYYFQRGTYDEEIKISGASVSETILAGLSACHGCVIACGRVVRLTELDSGEKGNKRKGPEYETLVGFGPNLGLNDPEVITRLGELCDQYGMDSISLSNTIGLAFSLFEKGLIDREVTGGLNLQWGNVKTIELLIHQVAHRQSFGAFLAEGAHAFGQRFGVEQEAIQVNGLEVPYHDPRGASGMALVYATSPRGACHNQSDYFLVDIGQVEQSLGLEYFPIKAGAEKAGNVARHQDWRSVFNSLVMCFFANVSPETVVNLINAACGLDWDIEDMMRSGERGWNLKRVINHRFGLTGKNDSLPYRLLQPFSDDEKETEGFVPDFYAMRSAYYQARGWDSENGFPEEAKLKELGLGWLSEDLREARSDLNAEEMIG